MFKISFWHFHFPLVSQLRLIFLFKKKKLNKNFGRISMRGPACTKETGDIYLLLQPTSSVYTGGTLVCLGIPGSKQYHCIRHALCCFSFVSFNMLSPLLYNFHWGSRLSSPNFEVKFCVFYLKKKSHQKLCAI